MSTRLAVCLEVAEAVPDIYRAGRLLGAILNKTVEMIGKGCSCLNGLVGTLACLRCSLPRSVLCKSCKAGISLYGQYRQ